MKDDSVVVAEFSRHREEAKPHPLAELMACPPETSLLLNASAQSLDLAAGAVLFRQKTACKGIYIVVSGQLIRRTQWREARLALGPVRAGQLVELAAALGDGIHTFTLTAQTDAVVLLLPAEALNLAFQQYPPLRMHLLEELAREVSRGYDASCQDRLAQIRRRGTATQAP